MAMETCTVCFSDELEYFEDYVECQECGAQFEIEEDEDGEPYLIDEEEEF